MAEAPGEDGVCTEKARVEMLKAARRARDAGLSMPLVRMAITGLGGEDPKLDTLSRRAIYGEQSYLFLVYSSTSALLGLSRSSDYSACNGIMDCFLPHRRAQGLQMFSTRWGEVLGTGLADLGKLGRTSLAPWEKIGMTMQGKFNEYKKFYMNILSSPPNPKADQKLMPIMTQLEATNNSLRKQCFEKAEELYCVPEENEDLPPTSDSMRPAAGKLRVFEQGIAAKSLERGAAAADTKGFAELGSSLSVTTKSARDRVLLLGQLAVEAAGANTSFTLKRSSYPIGPVASANVAEYSSLLVPWLDKPCESSDYEIHYRCDSSAKLKSGKLSAITIPGEQVTSSKSRVGMDIESSRWYNVPGMQQVSVPGPGEKVLIICTLTCTPKWHDSMTRGLFRILRDGMALDLGLGIQSVQQTREGGKVKVTLCYVDNPNAGVHLYMVQSMVVSQGSEQSMRLEDGYRQLALIRLPGNIAVLGPQKKQDDAKSLPLDKDAWTSVPGLDVTVDVLDDEDKVLIVYNTILSPGAGVKDYEAGCTIMRTQGGEAAPVNLGDQERGTWLVSSKEAAGCEYPIGMLVDSPGAGTHTYKVNVRAKAPVSVGPDGRVSAVILTARPLAYDAPERDTVMDEGALSKVQDRLLRHTN